MNKIVAFSVFLVLILSCKKPVKEVPTITGAWRLTEQFLGTGAGSDNGYVSVNSLKKVTFWSDGTFSSNGSLCYPTTEITSTSSGIYNTTSETITLQSCDMSQVNLSYAFEGDNLIISYPCIEECFEKFVKVN